MQRHLFATMAVIATALVPGLACASDRSDIIATVQGFNSAPSTAAYQAYCTDDAVVVDHVGSFAFHGPTACADEWNALVAWGHRENFPVETMVQKLFDPVFLRITGDDAFAVFPARPLPETRN